MSKRKKICGGKLFCPWNQNNPFKLLQTPHRRQYNNRNTMTGRRAFPRRFSRKGSLALEAAMALPLLLFAVTALLWIFTFTASQARSYRTLTERAQTLAVTVGQASEGDPYIRLYDYDTAKLPFWSVFHGSRPVVQQAVARSWVGYTGENFSGTGAEEIVYMTPGGSVFHLSRDCTYLSLTVQSIASSELSEARNLSGGKYAPCEYCVGNRSPAGTVYITDYGTSYHNSVTCQGLKRTIMAVPRSQTGGRPCCSKCGAGL